MAEYIEKQRLLDFLDAAIEEEKGNRHQVIVEAIKMTIERMPSVDVVERKRGKWVWNNDNGYYYCSKCGSTSPREYQDGAYIDCPIYCPSCGAEMRGVGNDP